MKPSWIDFRVRGFRFKKRDKYSEKELKKIFPVDFKIEVIAQDIYRGNEMILFSVGRDWFIRFSSGDISYFEDDEKSAKEFFKSLIRSGDLI